MQGKEKMPRHSFVVCAYGESPYLEACLKSLKAQTVPSEILICTSTPNRHVEQLAVKYGIPLKERDVQREGGVRGEPQLRQADMRCVIGHVLPAALLVAAQDQAD